MNSRMCSGEYVMMSILVTMTTLTSLLMSIGTGVTAGIGCITSLYGSKAITIQLMPICFNFIKTNIAGRSPLRL